jgi:hypothetical protein
VGRLPAGPAGVGGVEAHAATTHGARRQDQSRSAMLRDSFS